MGREVAHPESCHPHGELGEIILHWNTVSTLEHTCDYTVTITFAANHQ